MSGQTTALATAAGAVIASGAAGPLSQVFSELTAVLAIMGAAGGVTWGLANRRGWLETLRGLVLGLLLAAGFGVMSPHVLNMTTGVEFEPGGNATHWLASCAFFLGLAQDLILAKLKKILK
jgi:hypothetical protein